MKIYILIGMITWAFYHPIRNPDFVYVVDSKQEASILVYRYSQEDTLKLGERYREYHLYEFNPDSLVVREIPIPQIQFIPGTFKQKLRGKVK